MTVTNSEGFGIRIYDEETGWSSHVLDEKGEPLKFDTYEEAQTYKVATFGDDKNYRAYMDLDVDP